MKEDNDDWAGFTGFGGFVRFVMPLSSCPERDQPPYISAFQPFSFYPWNPAAVALATGFPPVYRLFPGGNTALPHLI
jgi:hypothetical protein